MKRVVKRILVGLSYLLTLPLILATWLEGWLLGPSPSPVYGSCKEILALCPTPAGELLRLAYYRAVCRDISIDTTFLFGSMLARRDITIGAGTVVGAHSILGFARVGTNVLMGARVSLLSGKYQHGRPGDRISGDTDGGEFETITIGDDCFIGQDAVIMANVGNNCTVAAGSVVYKEVPDGITVMGNPARKVNL